VLDSVVDAASSVTLVAVRVSLQHPDHEHCFGHGAGLIWSAAHRLREPHVVELGLSGGAVIAVSSVVPDVA
jgi:divalent metal cation (Fe/Co/Zn/Cd) transporter